ncbi:MAG: 16S rRNA (guanine(527)-N(7))-methyltransferase RsmG [Chloroflexi bacterium]|nr:16S rRNA (guanine(527)-N(7))-methyltransferase RsmG [Chloroflexota bacterium]
MSPRVPDVRPPFSRAAYPAVRQTRDEPASSHDHEEGLPLLRAGAARLGVALSPAQLAAFRLYLDLLLDWNRRINLTAIRDPVEVERLLFLDSLTLLLAFPGGAERVVDVGSGAGIPGLPLKIAAPELQVTLLEATGKKVRFLEQAVGLLGLTGVAVVQGRAEELGHAPEHRQAYGIVIARALAPLRVLAELCLPFAHVGGVVIAPKGAEAAREAAEAQRAVRLLGGEVREVSPVALPELPPDRHLVVLEKVAPTPPLYPRRSGIPAKRPL